jgi:hypothetical protein
MKIYELPIVGKKVVAISHTEADCGIRLTFDDDSTLEIGFSYMYGDTIFTPSGKESIVVDDNPFDEI